MQQPAAKLRALMKLIANRVSLVQAKRTAIAKQERRRIAELLKSGKVESARIRVESIIQEDIHNEFLELLELYSEVVLARCGRIENNQILDERLDEAIHVLLYAQPYVDIKELQKLKPMIASMVTKEYVQQCSENSDTLPERVVDRIHVEVPSSDLVQLYLVEICKAYSVSVPGVYEVEEEEEPAAPANSEITNDDNSDTQASTNTKNETKQTQTQTSDQNDLWARFEALKK